MINLIILGAYGIFWAVVTTLYVRNFYESKLETFKAEYEMKLFLKDLHIQILEESK